MFSGAVAGAEKASAGDLVAVLAASGRPIGHGTYHPGNTIRVRMVSPSGLPGDSPERFAGLDVEFFLRRFAVLAAGKAALLPPATTGYRLAHADADYLPGLIVDVYGRCAVFQIHTAGMEPCRGNIVEALRRTLGVDAVVERSDVEARRQEGLAPLPPAVHVGAVSGPVWFLEDGFRLVADVLRGQKTGFYLDQRATRAHVRRIAAGREVTNLFCYSGAASVMAAAAGARSVVGVDTSAAALDLSRAVFRRNGIDPEAAGRRFIEADAFDYLESEGAGEGPRLILADPPAFAKHRDAVSAAEAAYRRLNALCLRRLDAGDALVTSSCSGMISRERFRTLLRHAAGEAGADAAIVDELSQAPDHTRRLAFPEGEYLKTLVLAVGGRRA